MKSHRGGSGKEIFVNVTFDWLLLFFREEGAKKGWEGGRGGFLFFHLLLLSWDSCKTARGRVSAGGGGERKKRMARRSRHAPIEVPLPYFSLRKIPADEEEEKENCGDLLLFRLFAVAGERARTGRVRPGEDVGGGEKVWKRMGGGLLLDPV